MKELAEEHGLEPRGYTLGYDEPFVGSFIDEAMEVPVNITDPRGTAWRMTPQLQRAVRRKLQTDPKAESIWRKITADMAPDTGRGLGYIDDIPEDVYDELSTWLMDTFGYGLGKV